MVKDQGQMGASIATASIEACGITDGRLGIFDNDDMVILLIDPSSGHIIGVNSPSGSCFGHDELLGKKIMDLNVLPKSETRDCNRSAAEGIANKFVFSNRLPSEEVRNVEVLSGPIKVHGQKLLFSVIRDVTERKNMENRLIQTQRMENVGVLACGIAHDFGNLLAALHVYGHLVVENPRNDDQVRELAQRVLHIAKRGTELSQNLLAFSRNTEAVKTLCDANWWKYYGADGCRTSRN